MMSAMAASAVVQKRLLQGKRVLSTCYHGRNRSGLVSAMSLVRTFGMRPSMAIKAVRVARRNALQNPRFLMFLMSGEKLLIKSNLLFYHDLIDSHRHLDRLSLRLRDGVF